MSDSELQGTVKRYYQAWARQDRAEVRSLLADDLDFRSPQDRFSRADDFLDACWQYSMGLAGVKFLEIICSDSRAFAVLDWHTGSGSRFAGAEYLKLAAGKIHRIVVLNNSPEFGDLFGR